jgi:hypothetical protein
MSKLSQKHFPNIKFKNTFTKEIERIISSLRPTNSYGYDEISTKILKASAPCISSPLNYISNKTVGTSHNTTGNPYSQNHTARHRYLYTTNQPISVHNSSINTAKTPIGLRAA